MKQYYVYKVTFLDGAYYIGFRGSCQEPEKDLMVKYFTSSKMVKSRIAAGEIPSYEILARGLEKEPAYEQEQKLIFDEFNNTNCLNEACYYGRDGFGCVSDSVKERMSAVRTEMWQNDEYKNRMREAQSASWDSERRDTHSSFLKDEFWTDERKESHSSKLKGRPGHKKCKGVKKHDGFGDKVSEALKGKPKSDEHKEKLRVPKPRICRIEDRKEMSVNHFGRWIKSLLAQ